MIVLYNRLPMNHVPAMVGAFALLIGCDGGPAIPGPLPDVDGLWSVLRTDGTGDVCVPLPDLKPVPMTIRTTGRQLEFQFMPTPSTTQIFRGALHEDGDFELHWEEEDPGFSNARSTLEGNFVGDAFMATQTTLIDAFDPFLIELLGGEHCETTQRWEGERISL